MLGLLCFSRSLSDETKSILARKIHELPDEPEGKQMLTLFRINGIQKYEPHDLITTKELLMEYSTLLKKPWRGRGRK